MIFVRFLVSCWLFVLGMGGFAQNNTTMTFKVRENKPVVHIGLKDTVFYTDHNNVFSIDVSGNSSLGRVELEGGKIARKGNRFCVRVDKGDSAVLIVYVKKTDGTSTLGKSKLYPIVHLPNPVSEIKGVKNDSIINRADLQHEGLMKVKLSRFNKTRALPVVSFGLIVPDDNRQDTLTSDRDKLSHGMRNYIRSLKPGIPLQFVNILCRMPSGEIRKLAPMRLFVDFTSKYGVLRK